MEVFLFHLLATLDSFVSCCYYCLSLPWEMSKNDDDVNEDGEFAVADDDVQRYYQSGHVHVSYEHDHFLLPTELSQARICCSYSLYEQGKQPHSRMLHVDYDNLSTPYLHVHIAVAVHIDCNVVVETMKMVYDEVVDDGG